IYVVPPSRQVHPFLNKEPKTAHNTLGGLVLCEYFEKEKMSFTGKKVIELGSGTGIVGILAVLLGGNVTFTDQTFILKKMKYNISVNIPPWLTNHTKVCALSWDDDLSCFPTDYDVILGSDIVYSSSSYPSLLQTLQHLSNHSTTIYISSDVRPVNECNVFHAEMLPKHFHCERVHQSGNNRIHVYKLTKKHNCKLQGAVLAIGL
uniref:Uncharacterized protein n=1 Tax=Callorhinchus milii TaxID=7868 RepID=A0A4W3JIF5_CALMI